MTLEEYQAQNLGFDPNFWNAATSNTSGYDPSAFNNQYNVDADIGGFPSFDVDSNLGGFPSYNVNPAGTIPGTGNMVDPTGGFKTDFNVNPEGGFKTDYQVDTGGGFKTDYDVDAIGGFKTDYNVAAKDNPWIQQNKVDPEMNPWLQQNQVNMGPFESTIPKYGQASNQFGFSQNNNIISGDPFKIPEGLFGLVSPSSDTNLNPNALPGQTININTGPSDNNILSEEEKRQKRIQEGFSGLGDAVSNLYGNDNSFQYSMFG